MKKYRVLTFIAYMILTVCLVLTSMPHKPISTQPEATKPLLPNTATMVLQTEDVTTDNIVFPSDGGIINVKNAPYNAKGDGITDDTAAIQQAFNDNPGGNRIIYLPNGTYLVSNQIQWPDNFNGSESQKRNILQGQSTAGTIIKLKNSASGFTDPATPKSVIWTGSAPAQRFRNAIRNLTVDTGTGNAGAIAIQFIANNQGAVRNVTIQSGDGQGIAGLDLIYTNEVGPCLIKNVKVIGFNRGISTGYSVDSQTFENITLQNQREYGFYNGGQVISIRGLTSTNAVPAVYNPSGLVTLLDSSLKGVGGASSQPAINNGSKLFARNITTSGYQIAIQNNDGTLQSATGSAVSEFVSHPIDSVFPTPLKSLNLPIQETPNVPWDALSEWESPTHFGAVPDDDEDDSAAIQAAIDSGKTTVYFPNGSYNVGSTIYIRNKVRKIIGLEARIRGAGVFQFDDGSAPVVVIERFDGSDGGPVIKHASARTLVLSSMSASNYTNTGTGDLFIEDVSGAPWKFTNQTVWARQINPENDNATHITNTGGTLWILGLKTERGGIIVDTKAGAKTEITGGLIYSTSDPKTTPMFTNDNSSVSLTICECNYNGNHFTTLVSETRDDVRKTLNRGDTPERCGGSVIPLYVGYK